jgi:hypothetical protein
MQIMNHIERNTSYRIRIDKAVLTILIQLNEIYSVYVK